MSALLAYGTPFSKVMEKYSIKPEDLEGWEDVKIGQMQARKGDELSGTYQMLYQSACDYAKNHLNSADYHNFCERLMRTCYYWY